MTVTTHTMTSTPDTKRIDKYIPWMFVAFFLVIAAVDAVFVTLAIKTNTGLVTESAYEKGLDYNATLEAAAKQAALGWQSSISYENGQIALTLKNKAGEALTGAKVRAHIIRPVTSGYDTDIELVDQGRGVYVASYAFPLKGQWQVHAFASVNGQDYQTSSTLTVP